MCSVYFLYDFIVSMYIWGVRGSVSTLTGILLNQIKLHKSIPSDRTDPVVVHLTFRSVFGQPLCFYGILLKNTWLFLCNHGDNNMEQQTCLPPLQILIYRAYFSAMCLETLLVLLFLMSF